MCSEVWSIWAKSTVRSSPQPTQQLPLNPKQTIAEKGRIQDDLFRTSLTSQNRGGPEEVGERREDYKKVLHDIGGAA